MAKKLFADHTKTLQRTTLCIYDILVRYRVQFIMKQITSIEMKPKQALIFKFGSAITCYIFSGSVFLNCIIELIVTNEAKQKCKIEGE